MNNDLKSRAKNGFFYPLEFNEVVHFAKQNEMNKSYPVERIGVKFRNYIKGQKNPFKIVRFYPREWITFYSLPEEISEKIKKSSVISCILKLVELKNNREYDPNVDSYYGIDFDSTSNEYILYRNSNHFKTIFNFRNKAKNRYINRILKREIRIIERFKFRN